MTTRRVVLAAAVGGGIASAGFRLARAVQPKRGGTVALLLASEPPTLTSIAQTAYKEPITNRGQGGFLGDLATGELGRMVCRRPPPCPRFVMGSRR
jgi:hypothetical protein